MDLCPQLLHDRDGLLVVEGAVIEVQSPIILVEANGFRSQEFRDCPSSRVPSTLCQYARIGRRRDVRQVDDRKRRVAIPDEHEIE